MHVWHGRSCPCLPLDPGGARPCSRPPHPFPLPQWGEGALFPLSLDGRGRGEGEPSVRSVTLSEANGSRLGPLPFAVQIENRKSKTCPEQRRGIENHLPFGPFPAKILHYAEPLGETGRASRDFAPDFRPPPSGHRPTKARPARGLPVAESAKKHGHCLAPRYNLWHQLRIGELGHA